MPGLNVGLNVSIARHIYLAVDRAVERTCTCFQIFARSPRRFRVPPLAEEDAAEFRRRRLEAGLAPLAVHVPYLLNLASPDDDFWAECIEVYAEDLRRADALGADLYVTHLGSPKWESPDFALSRVADALERVFETYAPSCRVLLENTAGGAIGHRWEHMAAIMERARGVGGLGVCLDTAHAFAAGYDVSRSDGLARMLDGMDRLFGLDRLCLVHANDSKTPLGSGLDRHEHIGRGAIGSKGFAALLAEGRLSRLPFILETPTKGLKDDIANIRALRKAARKVACRRGGD